MGAPIAYALLICGVALMIHLDVFDAQLVGERLLTTEAFVTTLRAGMAITIEPMVNLGRADVKVLDDGWTVVTKDRSLSAQFEHMVAVTPSSVASVLLRVAVSTAGL